MPREYVLWPRFQLKARKTNSKFQYILVLAHIDVVDRDDLNLPLSKKNGNIVKNTWQLYII